MNIVKSFYSKFSYNFEAIVRNFRLKFSRIFLIIGQEVSANPKFWDEITRKFWKISTEKFGKFWPKNSKNFNQINRLRFFPKIKINRICKKICSMGYTNYSKQGFGSGQAWQLHCSIEMFLLRWKTTSLLASDGDLY